MKMNNDIIIDLDSFYRSYRNFKSHYELKNIPDCIELKSSDSVEHSLDELSKFLLKDLAVFPLYYSLRPIFIELTSRLITNLDLESEELHKHKFNIPGSIILNSICKVVQFSGELLLLVEWFLKRQEFFKQIEKKLSNNVANQFELQNLLLAFYRLILKDRQKFVNFVNPKILYSILRNDNSTLTNKFLSIQLLSLYLQLSESLKIEMIELYLKNEEPKGYYEGDEYINYTFLSVLEAKRLSNFTKLPPAATLSYDNNNKLVIGPENLSKLVISVCGILLPVLNKDNHNYKSEFVPINKSISALKKLIFNFKEFTPTILIGKAGSGKTFLINELSKISNQQNSIIKIHLNDQTDAKLLLGTYISDVKPGTFIWKNGVLTTAVKEGRPVLIEDIDKAPTEVLSILLTLLEKKEITIPSRGEVIKAANGFQLISTIRIANDANEAQIPDLIGLRLWNIITLQPLDYNDLMRILREKYPLLVNLLPNFIKLFSKIIEIYNTRKFISLNKGSKPRVITTRDLMKFCGRSNKLLMNNGAKSSEQLLTTEIYDLLFQEAVDCFTSSIVEITPLNWIINEIGQTLEVPSSRIQLFLNKNIPIFENYDDHLKIGRALLNKSTTSATLKKARYSSSFAKTNHSLRLMEQIGVSISMCEPVLLVGETGTGKTTVVQQVAKMLNKKLVVINVSQQTEIGDLLGGYKPVNTKIIALPLQELFDNLFHRTFSIKKNAQFMEILSKCFNKNQWKNVIRLWKEAVKMAKNHLSEKKNEDLEVDNNENGNNTPKKKRKLDHNEKKWLMDQWNDFNLKVADFEKQAIDIQNSFVFQFIEGLLVKAVRNGDWLLLDEINLGSSETLESISDLLSEKLEERNILLSEKGEIENIEAHTDFRIFACMNPSTDVGKKDLPVNVRSRFTEIYVHSPDRDLTDLLMIIDQYIGKYSLSDEWCGNDVAQLYLEAKRLAENNQIVDGANKKPHFSIRTLTRTLLYVCDIVSIYGLRRSLYEGFSMSFTTLLDADSEKILKPIIEKYTIGRLKNQKSVLSQIPPNPSSPDDQYVQFRHYWMKHGPNELKPQPHYIITPFVEKNMLNLVRATSGRQFPVLIQGPTSSGKTSMINYLANITGHKFVRINNHEHTDLQEYLGSYISDQTGKLVFKEGILVEALRKGYWIVLDELNLAPTDVLEALNRLLDDNRELLIPETQEVVHPHPDFMLFATQNPPGLYGGRKILSRAFRNRFLELHYDDIPQDELETILKERCQIAPSYCKKIVEVYRQLTIQRQSTRLFEQKNSFATLRDLFRWAEREAIGYDQLAANGYMLLAERVRREDEKALVKQVLEKVMKVKLNMAEYYRSLENEDLINSASDVIWTKAMRRLSVLVISALRNNEPILLVGETGCGKTTICQLIAEFTKKKLITVNAHQNTETGDILGAQRPMRNRSEIQQKITSKIIEVFSTEGIEYENDDKHDFDKLYNKFLAVSSFGKVDSALIDEIKKLNQSLRVLFEWCDGPLIQALESGNFFLLDEISLADDAVLERLNSVLEPERSLLLAEKGTTDALIVASDGFEFLATMNPGGDYGKKELSPALRNRFTEIWVPSMDDFEDVRQIVGSKLVPQAKSLCKPLVSFAEWYGKKFGGGDTSNGVISLRDILAWVQFINSSLFKIGNANACLLHGGCMVFIDSLGTNNTAFLAENEENLRKQKLECAKMLSDLVNEDLIKYYSDSPSVSLQDKTLKCGLFEIPRLPDTESSASFNLEAPTTATNAMRVVRAMQVAKPILLEGSPGVGKTSLISALAAATGNKLTRINLSEQTDLIDLFGSDAPAEGGNTGEFAWRDAPFLRAMQKGEWVLLDEMNLASQSVLEGLNACLDHRGEAYIPELNKSFNRHENFVVFAAQNPQYQGGGRKGLPKSFVNRFTVVYVNMLTSVDLNLISHHIYPNIDPDICSKMIEFISKLEENVVIKKKWGSLGSPWEFNLRDTLRWLELYNSPGISESLHPGDFLNIIVEQRFRSKSDREEVRKLYQSIFGEIALDNPYYVIGEKFLQIGREIIARKELIAYGVNNCLFPLQCTLNVSETVLTCINRSWPLIIVGKTNSGKTELIKFIASVVGVKVEEFSMNSDVDSMDILGGYEQVDFTRIISQLCSELQEVLLNLTAINLRSSTSEPAIIARVLDLLSYVTYNSIDTSNFGELMENLNSFMNFTNNTELFKILEKGKSLLKRIHENSGVKFEWFDGLLVQAVEKGSWLILDNANLCSPSVLDRLNSLLEPNGSLIINECSAEDGLPRCIKPHPNFRLFLTMDPKHGELSRAMRNRGVEVFVETIDECATPYDREVLGYGRPYDTENEDIDNKLSQLVINVSVGKPVSSFLCPADSIFRSYCILLDVFEMSNAATRNQLVNIVTSTLPFSALRSIDRFSEVVTLSTEFFSFLKTFVSGVRERYMFMEKLDLLKNLYGLYESPSKRAAMLVGCEIDYSDYQTPNILINRQLLLSLIEKGSNLNSSEHIYLFELAFGIFEASLLISKLDERASNSKVNELNYLERSAAFSCGRNIKRPARLNVYSLLKALSSYISDTFSTISSSDLIFESESLYSSLFELQMLWRRFYENSKFQDESKLRVYQELISNWIEINKSNQFFGIYLKNFLNAVNDFSQKLALKTGTSIGRIWEHFRSAYPSSEQAWINRESIDRLADEFDEVAYEQFSDSAKMVHDLRILILQLYDEASTDVEISSELVENLSGSIAQLKEISSKFLNKRIHIFEFEFTLLLNFMECSSITNNEDLVLSNDFLTSSLQSKKHTTSMTRYRKEIYKPYPIIFDSLWKLKNEDYISFVRGLFMDEFVVSSLKKCANITNIPGTQLNQALDDISQLGSLLVNQSSSILADQMENFKNLLIGWVSELCSLHLSVKDAEILKSLLFVDSPKDVNVDKIFEIIQFANDENFINIFKRFFAPSLWLLLSNINTAENLGKAWILFSCGSIQLFVPSFPLDPATKEYVEYDIYMQQKEFVETFKESWNQFSKVSNSIIDCLPTISSDNIPTKPRVFRSSFSVDSLFYEWQAFMESSIDSDPVQRLLDIAIEFNKSAIQQIDTFQKNSFQFISRLDQSYSRYADLNDILRGYIFGLKLGYDLITVSKVNSTKESKSKLLWPLQLGNITIENELMQSFSNVSEFCKSQSITSVSADYILIYFMKLYFVQAKTQGMVSTDLNSILGNIFQGLYYRWSLRRMKKEEEEAIQSSMYRFNDSTMDAEAEFKSLFPDYEDVMDLKDNHGDKNSFSTDDVYLKLMKTYISVFLEKEDIRIKDIMSDGLELVKMLEKSDSFKDGFLDSSVLIVLVNKVSSSIDEFSKYSTDDIDFYRDFNPTESKRVIDIIEKLQGSVHNLLLQWPDHATLQNIFMASSELLSFPSNTPLAKLIQKLEQIYTFISEWEKFSHSKISLKSNFDEIAQLIISWRKLELRTWKSLFANEDKAMEKNIGKWWFHLFETIIVPIMAESQDVEIDEVKILAAINIFLSQTTYGEYFHRLTLLKAFSQHVKLISSEFPMYDAISNVILYYEQFSPIIKDEIAVNRKQLEKSISEIILLASWKDVNADALKQSARRSHHSLYKIVRKYRELLSKPVSVVIEGGLSSSKNIHVSVTENYVPKAINIDAISINEVSNKILLENHDLIMIIKKMDTYVENFKDESLPDIYEFSKDLLKETESLRKETPTQLSQENKKDIAALKSRKRKLMSDTLKELRRMGLKTHLSANVTKKQSSINLILTKSKTFKETKLEGSDLFFFRILDLLPRLRASMSNVSPDVPVTDAQKGLAVIENLLYSLISARKPLVKASTCVDEINFLMGSVEKLSAYKKSGCVLKCSLHEGLALTKADFEHLSYWLPKILDYGLYAIDSASRLTKKSVDTDVFVNAKLKIKDFASNFHDISLLGIMTSEDSTLFCNFNNYLVEFICALNGWKAKNNSLSFVAEFILSWIDTGKISEVASSNYSQIPFNASDLEKVEKAFRDLTTSVILSVQNIVSLRKSESISVENDNWFLESQQRLSSYIQLLNGKRIKARLTKCLDVIFEIQHNEITSGICSTICAAISPLLSHYSNLASLILNNAKQNYIETSHSTFILSSILHKLATEGFCSPEPQQQSKEKDDLQDGTGLGEGEGETNNSKDVEDDEDLSEHAQKENEKNKDDGDDDNGDDDAVSIEGDMAGDLEEAPDAEDDENDEDKADEDLDEEIDDIDDLDPNAIDEKMWDEETKEDTKQKDSDKMPQNSNEDDELQAMDEENEKEKRNETEDLNKDEEAQENSQENDENGDEEEQEGEEEEGVGEQEDEIKNKDDEKMEANADESEALELSDDMHLDSSEEDNSNAEDSESFDDKMNSDEEIDMDENKEEMMENNEIEEPLPTDEVKAESDEDHNIESEDERDDDQLNKDEKDETMEGAESDMELLDKEEEETESNEANKNENAAQGLEQSGQQDEVKADEASAKQKSGQEEEGANAETQEEKQDIGASGTAQFQQDNQEESESNADEARDMARQSLKQLGDSLKEFHRRRQEIKEASEQDDLSENAANKRPDEFQHIEGENTEFDTQALGAASKDQIQTINEDMAVDDDLEQKEENDAEQDLNMEDDRKMDMDEAQNVESPELQDPTEDFNGQSKTAFVGDRNKFDEFSDLETLKAENIIEDDTDFKDDLEISKDNHPDKIFRSLEEAHDLWRQSDIATQELSAGLTEQLRLILEPTLATKLRGDYKTGKRLNMKRIIPYIASQFRKDKIWLRRTKPSKRQYQIMIAVDDSKSMSESKSVDLAFKSIALVSKALTQLESGALSIVKFGEYTEVVHPFDKAFTADTGAKIFQSFDFGQTRTDIKKLVSQSIKLFDDARASGNSDLWQLEIILSDGVCEDHETVQRLVRRARENKIMLVFVIIDGINSSESILDMSQVSYVPDASGKMVLKVDKYLDTFPFEFYVVVHNINELPEMLAIILRQYFSELASM
ncbi:hypothetical protein PACTADRAFT_71717 [Pachysolen tannophilus NRRL Y-2460]|uniref:Midasin n=1 Tax=Pachysolen tannophilus NRRL Y-2460 TaxID=669874 RepID=A0A1E4TPV3_PACTA|nr:hypothetical protein PACTADRAFT_71717 [Pachysolen tannophilus NRRL Y-2460]